MVFTEDDLQDAFVSSYFQRGLAYFRQNKVVDLEIVSVFAHKVVFESKVKGSKGRIYQQKTTIKQSDSDVEVHGYCSCPMDYNCKHVVAACLKYQNEEISPAQSAKAWLNQLVSSLDDDALPTTPSKEFLVYVIRVDEKTERLKVCFHKTKLLKTGGIAKGKRISIATLSSTIYIKPKYICTSDQDIVKLILADDVTFGSELYIKGAIGFVLMQKMLATGRCYWHQPSKKALRWGESRQFTQDWLYDAEGNAQLRLQVRPHAALLPTEPALFLDTTTHEVGLLDNVSYNAEQLQLLMDAPQVPKDVLEEFSLSVAQTLPKNVLEPPKEIEVEDIVNKQPIPCLLLYTKNIEQHHFRLARLRFSYADYELSMLPEDQVRALSHGHAVLNIHRNLTEEQHCVDSLQALGLEGAFIEGRDDLYFFFHTNDEIDNDRLWSEFIVRDKLELEEKGWRIDIADNFNMQLYDAQAWEANLEEQGNDWFHLRFDVEVNGQKQNILPLISRALEYYDVEHMPEILTLPLNDGEYLNIPREQIKPVLDILYALYDRDNLSDDGALQVSRFDAGHIAQLEQEHDHVQWFGGESLRELGQKLNDFDGIKAAPCPQGLNAELRQYQQQGLNWMQFLRSYQFNGILADDMGLGKTVQTLSHLLLEKEQGRMDKPCLIIAPTSLMGNWRREAALFTPSLKVLVLQGSERSQYFDKIQDYDLVLSTYPLLARDKDVLLSYAYHILVLDEAQLVKNPKSQAAKVVRSIKTRHRLCLTGTPMENHLGELWALFDFLMPGFLGDLKQFNQLYRTPIEKHGNSEQQQRLVQRISPFMLRRTKDEVLAELPEKTEIIRTVTLGKKQAALYESIRISMEKKVRDVIASKGLARSHITILDALLKLRQVCCDPRILSLKQAKKIEESAKLDLLMQILPEMLEEGRRILLFSQFTKMLRLIEDELKVRKINYSKLTGQTRKRDEVIEKFKQGKADVFLISLKAGGVGLNLTEADTVIHYDPWWNPAAENQATDRVHRIGQDKAVFVYKLVVENSVEEKIVAMQTKKQALADAVYKQSKGKDELQITADDLKILFEPLVE